MFVLAIPIEAHAAGVDMTVVEWRTDFSHLAPLPGLGMPEVVVVGNRYRRRRKRSKLFFSHPPIVSRLYNLDLKQMFHFAK